MSNAEERLAKHVAERTEARSGEQDSPTDTSNMAVMADSAVQGVTVAFLSQVFRIAPQKVKRLLVNCPVLEYKRRGEKQVQNLYDLKTAAEFLLEPKIDPSDIVKRLKKDDLPPAINSAYWDALLKRQKWEENAVELWRTDKVREVLGTMFQTIKFTIQLWGDTVERETGLTDEQRDVINKLTDGLQQDIYNELVKNAQLSETGNLFSELPELIGEPTEEDDFSDLI